MHAVFIPYGKKELVDKFVREMEAQKLTLRCFKEGEPDRHFYMDCQVRILPLGIMEFVFPREHKDIVLNTLEFDNLGQGHSGVPEKIKIMGMSFNPMELARKALKLDEIPEIKDKTKKLLWIKDHVAIVPLGVRYDTDIVEADGWSHEAI